MPSAHGLALTHHTSAEAVRLMDELCDVYADAYGAVPGEDTREKSSAFRERATAALQGINYSLVTAQVDDQLVGLPSATACGGTGMVGRAPTTGTKGFH
ncbi:MAG: hypothetical protein ACRDTA_18650 [Pseudonocardiaceae bacterium]